MTPRDCGLPHDEWRPNQLETIDKLSAKPSGTVTLLQAPVGSGKTGILRALAERHGLTALVKTKVLQYKNYDQTYNFDIIFGRANYPCVHPMRIDPDAGADQCLYELEMNECEYAGKCPYLIQKKIVQDSNVRCLNYAYFLTSKWPRLDEYATDWLFMDEAHLLSDEVTEWVGCTIEEGDRLRNGLPLFPSCYQSSRESAQKILAWMEQSTGILNVKIGELKSKKDAQSNNRKSRIERLRAKLAVTCSVINTSPDDWYIRAGQQALDWGRNKKPGLVVKPLTARHHFPRLFLENYNRVGLMSATIGDPQAMAEELGLENWEFEQVPHNWPVESRRVHVLSCPVLGHKSPESYYVKQAELIKNSLNGLPDDWSGIIHTQSWSQAENVVRRLISCGVDHSRLFVPQRGGTHYQMDQWEAHRKPGALIVTPSMSEGVDLLNERICIVAKCPFPFTAPGSYDYERMLYSNVLYRLKTAQGIEQRCGRTRRGRAEDYDEPGKLNGYVAICDGAFSKMGIRKYCSSDFQEALVID